MSSRSTRNKVRFQSNSAQEDLDKAMWHLARLAALGNYKSNYINKHLPIVITGLDTVITLLNKFDEGL